MAVVDNSSVTYAVIYADPPWKFSTYSARGKDRSAERWYDCLSVEEICALPVAARAARDCVLLLWATDPFLRRAFDVIEAWGFTYKTVGFCWAKCAQESSQTPPLQSARNWPIGNGYWTRANAELCLLATRGSPKRRSRAVPRLVVAPRRQHSRKPEEVYGRIEDLCPGPYLELFARQRRPGWDSWGDEIDSGPRAERRALESLS